MPFKESALQTACFRHLQAIERVGKDIFVAHVPNGGQRIYSEAKKFKAQGVRAGIPDLMVLKRGGKAFFIELKVKGNDLSDIQVDVQAYIDDLGFSVYNIIAETLYDGLLQLKAILNKEGV